MRAILSCTHSYVRLVMFPHIFIQIIQELSLILLLSLTIFVKYHLYSGYVSEEFRTEEQSEIMYRLAVIQ